MLTDAEGNELVELLDPEGVMPFVWTPPEEAAGGDAGDELSCEGGGDEWAVPPQWDEAPDWLFNRGDDDEVDWGRV